MPYDPRAPMMAPVQQFPQQPLMPDPLTAQMMMRRFGGAPQGLLDRSNAPAGLLGPPTVGPGVTGGLLNTPIPAIWDRILGQRGVSPMVGSEGGGRGMEGGGGRGYQPRLDLQGGSGEAPPGYRAVPQEPTEAPKFKLDWREYYGGSSHKAVTKSGMRVVMARDARAPDTTVDVVFLGPPGERGSAGRLGGTGSTKGGMKRFGEVFDAVKDYVQGFRPERLTFSGLTDKHTALYQRVVPLMAKELGGRVSRATEGGEFAIDLVGPGTGRNPGE